ncbi:hypothetical protein [Propionivibrio sp.]|uniref:hypothetical protein n=1 Tax=Propionivibrio sp. TaxID=2212460 RepID=UPI00260260C7|nr:hypothetical protein [Propionivibrio sp.]
MQRVALPVAVVGQEVGNFDGVHPRAVGDGDDVLDRHRVIQGDVDGGEVREVELLDVAQQVGDVDAIATL